MQIQNAFFKISSDDNVATALGEIPVSQSPIYGESQEKYITPTQAIPTGHKIALFNIKENQPIIKYGVVIGCATKNIEKGQWVHIHNMKSLYDERSASLDTVTGAPTDTEYI